MTQPRTYLSLLDHARATLSRAFDDDDLLATIDERDESSMLSRRLPEVAGEQLDALALLCRHAMWRPAYALLRGLLECMASMAWIASGPPDAPQRFVAGRSPAGQKLLGAVGWRDEYNRTFRYLSDMVHAGTDSAEAYRAFDYERSIREPAPEITPESELYVVGLPSPDAFVASARAATPEELRDKHEPYLTAKSFDIVISAIAALYGEERCRAAGWWPRDGVRLFTLCLRDHPHVRGRILWSGPEASGAWPQPGLDDAT